MDGHTRQSVLSVTMQIAVPCGAATSQAAPAVGQSSKDDDVQMKDTAQSGHGRDRGDGGRRDGGQRSGSGRGGSRS